MRTVRKLLRFKSYKDANLRKSNDQISTRENMKSLNASFNSTVEKERFEDVHYSNPFLQQVSSDHKEALRQPVEFKISSMF